MIDLNLLECHTKRSTIETYVDISINPQHTNLFIQWMMT
jgi:hypothetical protein